MSTRKADHTMRSVVIKSLVAVAAVFTLFGAFGADPAHATRPATSVESVCVEGVITSDVLSIHPESFTDQTVTISVDGAVTHPNVLPADGPFTVTVPHADVHQVGVEYELWSGVSWYEVTVPAIECVISVTTIVPDTTIPVTTVPAQITGTEVTPSTVATPTTVVTGEPVTSTSAPAEITGTYTGGGRLPETGDHTFPLMLAGAIILFLGVGFVVARSDRVRRWIEK